MSSRACSRTMWPPDRRTATVSPRRRVVTWRKAQKPARGDRHLSAIPPLAAAGPRSVYCFTVQPEQTRRWPVLQQFHALPAEEAERELRACCAARDWAAQVAAGRPYADVDAVCAAADAALADLDWAGITEALAAHPRIGDRAGGTGREAAWSRQEQAAAATGDEAVRRELAEANAEYERRFGRVFLICAAGLPAATILGRLRERLGHDEETERAVVREELREIVRLRVRRWLEGETR
ncbi:2-oxo-4-hydroxy-4-carboxy-5-ureidoimidazoline decarboxylase [Amycolatopsis thermalba]